MSTPGWRARTALVLGLAGSAILTSSAHQGPPQVESYFRAAGSALDVVARLPLRTLFDARLPVATQGNLDIEPARPKLEAAAAEFVRGIEVMDGNQRLPPPTLSWVVSPFDDKSFATFDEAVARFQRPQVPDRPVDASLGFLDIQLRYRLASATPRVSARFNGLRIDGQFVPTHAVYVLTSGAGREFTITGPPHRLSFEPGLSTVFTEFRKFATERLLAEEALLLFLFAVALLMPGSALNARFVTMTLVAYTIGAAFSALWPRPLPLSIELLAPMAASTALIFASVQNVVTLRVGLVTALCLWFGVADGLGAGLAIRTLLPLAGSHALAGFLTIVAGVALGVAIAAVVFRIGAESVSRLPVPSRAVPILLALIPLHFGLHQLGTASQTIVETSAAGERGNSWLFGVHYWPFLLAVASLAGLLLVSRCSGRARSAAS